MPLAPSTAFTLFMVYAALLGLMLSSVFLTYTGTSITRVFFISAAQERSDGREVTFGRIAVEAQ